MRSLIRNPLVWILAAAAGLRLAGLFWGLPASDGWEDDGFAPRNFLTALALTYKQGSYFAYPPLHAFLLVLLAWPGVIVALLHAPSFHQADVIAEIIRPGYMTFFAVIGRLVSLLMSLGIIWSVSQMTQLVAGRRAGLFAAGTCALNFGLTYYGQVSNLDVPYLFWGTLALLWCMRTVVEQMPERFWGAALFAAAAVATKDQAYALFLLSLPVFLLLWFAADGWPRAHVRRVMLTLLPAVAVALVLVLLVDGAITNGSGFARRIAFLSGPASRDYAAYPAGFVGLGAFLADMADWYFRGGAALASLIALAGLWFALSRRTSAGTWLAGLLPALAILSFTLCFNLAAWRSDARFLLPQAVLACFYIGIAAERLVFAPKPIIALAGGILTIAAALAALHACLAISAAFLGDPRYDAEAWLRRHAAGQSIETYGQNAYLPRFPAQTHVVRVGEGPLKGRNPLPGVTEVQAQFGAPRGARFIVVSDWWLRHYTDPQSELGGHRTASRMQRALYENYPARRYFTDLKAGRLSYRLAHASRPAIGLWPQVHIHESLSETILIFERAP